MLKKKELDAKELLLKRQSSYRLVFDPENVGLKDVMEDLKHFCRGDKSCFHADPRMHAWLEGRREVYQRIVDYLNLDSENLFKKHTQGEV